MSDAAAVVPATPTDSKSKKKRKNKKKSASTDKHGPAAGTVTDESLEESKQNVVNVDDHDLSDHSNQDPEDSDPVHRRPTSTNTSVDDDTVTAATNGIKHASISENDSNDPTARLDAMMKDRDALRAEVTELRQSLEQLTAKHKEDVDTAQKDLEEAQAERERAEEEYQDLLGKVNTIRSQLGERLKADAEELRQATTRIEDLEEQKAEIQERYTARSAEFEELSMTTREQESELSRLRQMASSSQQNWAKEREELIESETYLREEFENAKQAMHDWEVLAMEERQIRRDLADRVADLEEHLNTVQTDYERAAGDRDTQSNAVEGLQKAMQEIQDARRKELREVVESSQAELQTLRKQYEESQSENDKAKTELTELKREIERTAPFEKEVKEKSLLIGKLRHEAVILNDHLTKALRFLKKGKPEDNIDRHIVTNHFLHFLALDRSDPKKFQILQLIASLLNWTDEQKEQAGLARPGTSATNSLLSPISASGSMRLPGSPHFHRTPSTPALGADFFDPGNPKSPDGRESLAELWQNFLEQEAGQKGGSKSGQISGNTSVVGSTSAGDSKS